MTKKERCRMSKPPVESNVSIEEVTNFGMVSVKVNLSDNKVRQIIQSISRTQCPQIGKISNGQKMSVGWMSTDEYAIFSESSDAIKLVDRIGSKLKKFDHLCLNMSDSRRCFHLKGKGWREVISKGTPANLSPKAFGKGVLRRTRIANVAVAIWSFNETEAFIIAMTSVSDFILEWLNNASLETGRICYFS
jgi:sarcosine oxidase subunit gamma